MELSPCFFSGFPSTKRTKRRLKPQLGRTWGLLVGPIAARKTNESLLRKKNNHLQWVDWCIQPIQKNADFPAIAMWSWTQGVKGYKWHLSTHLTLIFEINPPCRPNSQGKTHQTKNFHLEPPTWWYIWVFPKIRVPQNWWFRMESPIKMDDLGVRTPIFGNTHMLRVLGWSLNKCACFSIYLRYYMLHQTLFCQQNPSFHLWIPNSFHVISRSESLSIALPSGPFRSEENVFPPVERSQWVLPLLQC